MSRVFHEQKQCTAELHMQMYGRTPFSPKYWSGQNQTGQTVCAGPGIRIGATAHPHLHPPPPPPQL